MRTRGLLLVLLWVTATTITVEAGRSTGAQFLAGTLGGYAGGAAGAVIVSRAFSAGATGWEALSRAILGAFVGLAGGTVVGSSLGVIAVGSILGIEGNIGLCLLGAATGTGTALGIGVLLRVPELIPYMTAPTAAAGATVGYRRGPSTPRELQPVAFVRDPGWATMGHEPAAVL